MQNVVNNLIIMQILLRGKKTNIHSVLQEINISLCEKLVDGFPHVFP